jgi:hypothetical protein
MNTSNPFFIFNSFGKQIRLYNDINLKSLEKRLTDQEQIEIKIYLNCLKLGYVYGADISK